MQFTPHPHVGNEWCIYPSYDYTHCIVDALENITHSVVHLLHYFSFLLIIVHYCLSCLAFPPWHFKHLLCLESRWKDRYYTTELPIWYQSHLSNIIVLGMSYYFMTFLLADDEKVGSRLRNCPGVPESPNVCWHTPWFLFQLPIWFLILVVIWWVVQLCTLEFESRRASYYWLLDSLDLYLPYVWEYSRLSIANTVMSKRKVSICGTFGFLDNVQSLMMLKFLHYRCLKVYFLEWRDRGGKYLSFCGTLKFQLNKLVTDHHVDGWDDCRLPTLAGLRRRGFTPDAINAFCRGIGITRRYLLLYH